MKVGTNINTYPSSGPSGALVCLVTFMGKNKTKSLILNLTPLAYCLTPWEAHKQWCQTRTEAGKRESQYKSRENNICNARFLTVTILSSGKEVSGVPGEKKKDKRFANFGETGYSHSSTLTTENE